MVRGSFGNVSPSLLHRALLTTNFSFTFQVCGKQSAAADAANGGGYQQPVHDVPISRAAARGGTQCVPIKDRGHVATWRWNGGKAVQPRSAVVGGAGPQALGRYVFCS